MTACSVLLFEVRCYSVLSLTVTRYLFCIFDARLARDAMTVHRVPPPVTRRDAPIFITPHASTNMLFINLPALSSIHPSSLTENAAPPGASASTHHVRTRPTRTHRCRCRYPPWWWGPGIRSQRARRACSALIHGARADIRRVRHPPAQSLSLSATYIYSIAATRHLEHALALYHPIP